VFKLPRSLFAPLILCLAILAVACTKEGTTEPKEEVVGVEVRFLEPSACARLDTPNDSLNMGVVEFENISTSVSIVPKQLAVRITSATGGTAMWQFGPAWRNTNNSITANIDAQMDPVASYIQFDVLPAIPPGGKFQTRHRGSLPSATAGTYSFAIIADSVRVKTVAGDSVKVTMGASSFALTTKTSCP
jgi:hypothetical protein